MRHEPVVQVYVVWKPVHQNDGRFFARVFSNVDSVLIPRYEQFSVGDHFNLTLLLLLSDPHVTETVHCFARTEILEREHGADLNLAILGYAGWGSVGSIPAPPLATSPG
jgi:hypothetical protein